MVKRFLHTRFRVSNLRDSIDFYIKTFGLKVIETKESTRGSKLAFLKTEGSEELLELCEYAPSGAIEVIGKDLVHLAFSVDSLKDYEEYLRSVGGKFSEPPSGHIAFIDDPDGYEIEIIEK